jgi:peptidoglycan hydrolase-like protein with peptidoglycan-binding domain
MTTASSLRSTSTRLIATIAALGVLASSVVGGSTSVAASFAPSAPASTSPTSVLGLTIGASGPSVKQVQEALIAANIAVAGGADGQFGPMTASAVREFQTMRGLEPTGIINEATALGLGLVSAPSPQVTAALGLTIGASGPSVKRVQEALIAANIAVAGGADGQFGPMTASAVREFQTTRGLEPNGSINEATALALLGIGAAAAGPTSAVTGHLAGLRPGTTGSSVRQLQQLLLAAGVTFAGGADGIYGPATANAVRIFQSRRGLPVTGEVDAITAQALASPDALVVVAPVTGGNAGATRSFTGLGPGSVGNNVRALQQALIAAGVRVNGGADGIFGPATTTALKEFQRRQGLSASGTVNQATADMLASPTKQPPSASQPPSSQTSPGASANGFATFGERGARVVALQTALQAAGVTVPGGADGIFGSQTAGAVMTFQRQQGFPVTGTVDTATASALGLKSSEAPSAPKSSDITLEVFPVQGRCSFGDTWHFPRGGGRLHEGVDIIAREGQLIYAVTDGTVTRMYHDRPGSLSGNGLRLTTNGNDGTYFFYAHFLDFAPGITVGTKVKAGQVLGYNGETGNAGTPHLHFEIHPGGGAAINPYPFVKAIDACSTTTPLPQR